MDRTNEFQYILDFSRENSFDTEDEVCCHQLRSLWTAYCLHHDLTPDTAKYDNECLTIWVRMESENVPHSYWKNFDVFEWWMGEHLS